MHLRSSQASSTSSLVWAEATIVRAPVRRKEVREETAEADTEGRNSVTWVVGEEGEVVDTVGKRLV